jgi:hypothetical protein
MSQHRLGIGTLELGRMARVPGGDRLDQFWSIHQIPLRYR